MADALEVAAYVGVLGGLIGFVSSFAIYFSGPSRLVNRYLALMLFFEGAGFAFGPSTEIIDIDWWSRGANAIFSASILLAPWLYFLFLGQALNTPFVRPLKGRIGQGLLLAGLLTNVVFYVWIMLTDSWVVGDNPGPAFYYIFLLALFASSFGIVAAASAFRRAKGSDVARIRAKVYLMAFVSRDAGMLLILTMVLVVVFARTYVEWFMVAAMGCVLLFVLFLNYGILRFHLLNLDYGLRLTIRAGFLAAFFLATFLIVTQLAEAWAARIVGDRGWVLGAVGAGLLIFAISPLQHMADRLSGKVLPAAKPMSQMTPRDRLGIYRDQVVVAWEDGSLSKKERRMLEVTRRRLGIGEHEALRLEREIVGA